MVQQTNNYDINRQNTCGQLIVGVGLTVAVAAFGAMAYRSGGGRLPEAVSKLSQSVLLLAGLGGLGAACVVPRGTPQGGRILGPAGREQTARWVSQFHARRRRPASAATYAPGNPLFVGVSGDPVAHDADGWRRRFEGAGRVTRADCRKDIFYTTLQALARGYRVGDQTRALDGVDPRYHVPEVRVVHQLDGIAANAPRVNTAIEVVEGDCIEVATCLRKSTGKRTAVLNMMNQSNRGGNPVTAGAQEENLCRRSNLYYHLDAYPGYPISGDFAMYSEDVCFFRGTEAQGYPFLETPVNLDVVGTAAVSLRGVSSEQESRTRTEAQEKLIKTRLRLVLRACHAHETKNVVLSALGCGAFHNHPPTIARYCKEVIDEAEFVGLFDNLRFAIIEDHNSQGQIHCPNGNLAAFRSVFHSV